MRPRSVGLFFRLPVSRITVMSLRKAPLQSTPSCCHPIRGASPPTRNVSSERIGDCAGLRGRAILELGEAVAADIGSYPDAQRPEPLFAELRRLARGEGLDDGFEYRPQS